MATVTHALSVEATRLPAGTALDLGCGEGADSIWLARHGWSVTGLDASETAVAQARATATRLGFPIDLRIADLTSWEPETTYDLVSAAFLPEPVASFADLAGAVAPGGHLIVVGDARETAAEERVRRLALDPERWRILVAEDRARGQHDAEGNPAILEDAVVVARRI